MYRLLALLALAYLILSVVLSSGCSTTPVVVHPQAARKPTMCMQSAPDGLAVLPSGFDGLRLEEQARTILLLHAQDGRTYQRVLIQLHACQAFVRTVP